MIVAVATACCVLLVSFCLLLDACLLMFACMDVWMYGCMYALKKSFNGINSLE